MLGRGLVVPKTTPIFLPIDLVLVNGSSLFLRQVIGLWQVYLHELAYNHQNFI